MKKTAVAALSILLSVLFCAVGADPKELNILWLGSSSTPPQLIHFVNQMLESDGQTKIGFSDKVGGYFNSAYLVTKGEGLSHNVGNGIPIEECLGVLAAETKKRKVDFVIIQVRHHTARQKEIAEKAPEYIKRICDAVRAAGAQPVFYIAPGEKSKKKQEALTELVAKLAKENNAPVAWGTEALLEVAELKGNEYVQNSRAGDAGHVGPFGNFTYANSLYYALTGKSPVGHPLRSITTTSWKVRFGDDIPADSPMYITEVPEEDARFIQETVEKVQKKLNEKIK